MLIRLGTEPYARLDPLKRTKLVEVLTATVEAAEKLLETIARDADHHPEGEDERD